MRWVRTAVALLLAGLSARNSKADETTPTPVPVSKDSKDSKDSKAEGQEEATKKLEQKLEKVQQEVDDLKEDQKLGKERVDSLMPLRSRITGYLDFGFFYVTGDGAGIRNDVGYERFPEYRGVIPDSWVFMGDPLSTTINSRGDPPETGESRAVTFNPIHNKGKPSFILNTLSLSLFEGIGDDLTLNGTVDFVSRGRDVSNPSGTFLGDYIDVKLGYVEYRIGRDQQWLSLYAGKFDSVLGIEYRTQEAPDRLTVTPSLICRYTCGHPLGVKARAKLLEENLVLNLALTNGSHFSNQFPFRDEIDANAGKTAAARISYRFPLGRGFELGASGAYGTQDRQTSTSVYQWHYGFDLRLEVGDLELRGEFVQGKAPGRDEPGQPPCSLAPCIEYKGAYGVLGYHLTSWFIPYTRVDWRNALHQSGASFVYLADLVRATVGVRFELGTAVIVKAEATKNQELGRIPQFPNDVFTSSLVVKY